MAVTLRFQSTGAVPGDGAPIVMRGPSLTIGRGPENDVVLPDPDRMISKNHCTIEDQGGDVVVIDFSTNGTFLNYVKTPLGRVPTPLNDGDVLTMGSYELVVHITSARADPMRDLAAPVDDGPVSHGRADHAHDVMDLLTDHSVKRTDFLDDLMGGAAPRGHRSIEREDPIDELDLPHLKDEEDPILGRLPDPLDDFVGGSDRYNSPSLNDGYSAPARQPNVIPDDWDDDFLSPTPKAAKRPAPPADDPFAPAPVRAAPALPPDAFDDLVPPPPTPPAPPASPAPLPTASVVPRPPKPRADPSGGEVASPFAAPVPTARANSVVPPPPAATPPASVPPPARPEAAAPAKSAAPQRGSLAAAAPKAAPAPVASVTHGDAVRAFFEGAGAEDLNIPEGELPATMARLGMVVKILIEGMREILMTRAEIKGEFRMERTQINAGGNNPLKFALSPEHAVEMILRPKARGYMDAPTAVREALNDIKAHEVAMVTGMEAAIKDVLVRLDPAVLSERIGSGGLGGLLGGKKARMWEEYERLYGTIAGEAENDFHEFFAKAFSKAYQDQLSKLK